MSDEEPRELSEPRSSLKKGLSKRGTGARRPSIYEDLPVSMASKISYETDDIESLVGGEVESKPIIPPPTRRLSAHSPSGSKVIEPKQSPSPVGSDSETGPIQKLFKPFF